jgi:hypothetical protein
MTAEYCGAIPPKPARQTAACLRTPGHRGKHRNPWDEIEWDNAGNLREGVKR